MGYNNVAEQWTTDPMKLEWRFIDLADSTHPDREINNRGTCVPMAQDGSKDCKGSS